MLFNHYYNYIMFYKNASYNVFVIIMTIVLNTIGENNRGKLQTVCIICGAELKCRDIDNHKCDVVDCNA